MVEVAYVRDSDEEFGTLKLCGIVTLPDCFKNICEELFVQAFKKNKINIDVNKYLKTFQSKGDRYLSDYIYFDEKFDRLRIDMSINGSPVLREKFNKNELTVSRVSKYKTQFYNFITLESKPKTFRMFYNSLTDDYVIVDCDMDEMKTLYEDLVSNKKINIQDYENNHIPTTVFDVRTFIKKEFDKSKLNQLKQEDVPFNILLTEGELGFKRLYMLL